MGETLGAIVEGLGAKAEADAAKDAANFNIALARDESVRDQEFVRIQAKKVRSENITRVAKSGVRLEGSPLQVLAENAANVERQLVDVRRVESIKTERAKAARRNAEVAGAFAIAGASIKAASSLVSFGARQSTASSGDRFTVSQNSLGRNNA